MANTHVYGFRWVRSLVGGGDTPQIITMPIASAYAPNTTAGGGGTAVNLNRGDPVKILQDGTLQLTSVGVDVAGVNVTHTESTFGIVVGFPRVLVGGFPRPNGFYTSGVAYTGGIGGDSATLCSVIPVEGNIFEVDADAVIGAGTKTAALGVVGQTARITYTPLTSGAGQPKANPLLKVSDLAAGGANQMQLLVTGLGKYNDDQDYTVAGATLQVMFTFVDLARLGDFTTPIFGAKT